VRQRTRASVTAASWPDRFSRLPRQNEVGFSAKNVLALCSMGESTKMASDPNHIGNKGIGFKSVFKLTASPRVHSRHFHLQFDARNGGLGYIVPSPATPPAGWDSISGGTRIVLPLDEGDTAKLRELRVHLGELKPSLLLFLRRLRHVEVDDALSGWRRSISVAHMEGDGMSTLAVLKEHAAPTRGGGDGDSVSGDGQRGGDSLVWSCTQQQRWLLVRRVLDAKVARLGIQRTELVLAFPLVTGTDGAALPPQDVCAYLPLRSYGLRFLLQAGALLEPIRWPPALRWARCAYTVSRLCVCMVQRHRLGDPFLSRERGREQRLDPVAER
jgi:hypothetical protein